MKHLKLSLPVLAIFCLALCVRLLYNIVVAHDYYPLHDSLTYQTIAYNLMQEHCYCLRPYLPTVDRAPLWPVLIALIYSIAGPQDHNVRLFLCIVGSGTCVLLYLFARELFPQRVALLAVMIAVFYPFLYIYDGWLYSESVYTFLQLAFCYSLYRFQKTARLKWAMVGGIILGLLSLTRPNGILLLGLVVLWAVLVGWKRLILRRIVTRGTLLMTLITLACVAPWTIRNYTVAHAFVPVAIGDGRLMLGAYNDMILSRQYYLGIWIKPEESDPQLASHYPHHCSAACEVQRDADYRVAATEWIESHISKIPYLLGLHFINLWQVQTQEADLPLNRFPDRHSSQVVVTMMVIITPVIFALAIIGLLTTRRRWREFLFLYFVIGLTILQALISYGIPRFRAPIEPLLILLAAGGLYWFMTRTGNRKSPSKF